MLSPLPSASATTASSMISKNFGQAQGPPACPSACLECSSTQYTLPTLASLESLPKGPFLSQDTPSQHFKTVTAPPQFPRQPPGPFLLLTALSPSDTQIFYLLSSLAPLEWKPLSVTHFYVSTAGYLSVALLPIIHQQSVFYHSIPSSQAYRAHSRHSINVYGMPCK